METFGKEAGPSRPATLVPGVGRPPSSQTPRFGAPNPNPNQPPFVHSPRSPWVPEAVERVQSPPLATASFAFNRPQFNGSVRRPSAPVGIRLPPPATQNAHPVAKQSYAAVVTSRPIGSPYTWVKGQSPAGKDVSQTNSGPAAVTSFIASRNAGTSFAANITRFHDPKTAKFLTPNSSNEQISGKPNQDPDQSHIAGPPLSFRNNNFPQPVAPLSNEGQWPVVSQLWHNQPQVPGSHPTMSHRQNRTPVPYSDLYDSGNGLNNGADDHYPKLSRGPVLPINEFFQEGSQNDRSESKRRSVSPPTWDSQSTSVSAASDAFIPPSSVRSGTVDEVGSSRSSSLPVAKRARSPPMTASDEVIPGKLNSVADSTERELQAKAKRLARFRKELHEDTEGGANPAGQTLSLSRHEFPKVEKLKNSGDLLMESAEDIMNGDTVANLGSSEALNIIMGLCPDMCPESERAERERKGDLDQYERVDGDRNQTNELLAVKKYTRTAEREATLIRPMPVLQKTIEYLLNMLDQPYDERLLGMYNFLWDRMRGIRMDLRMQHLFNEKAITMLEQMIRLHIVAMHELCEYTKGEGFSEGFDAHLNIEQMNKTSVELFQLYDDHRKRGINIPTEKEFRGYYALLKLDKHPGYKVEPAELSLDLAKMTPEIRQTPEVLFARDVARGCRTGNFIAFFRLARKASYLQACLMHAHFAKLRTLALAALHTGLQTNQGLPVTLVAKWLAMEDEDIESLLEYHGFSIKDFEEPYMVKEGLFLNSDEDYPTRCSKLVQLKRSRRIVDDISHTVEALPLVAELTTEAQLPKVKKRGRTDVPSAPKVGKKPSPLVEEEMPDVKYATFPKLSLSIPLPVNQPKIVQRSPRGHQLAGAMTPFSGISVAIGSPKPNTPKERPLEKPKQDTVPQHNKMPWGIELAPSPIVPRTAPDVISPSRNITGFSPTTKKTVFHQISPTSVDGSPHGFQVVKPITGDEIFTSSNIQDSHFMDEDECNNTLQDDDNEVALAKLRLIIRLWKRRASKLKELREQRQVATEAALSALTLGPQFLRSRDTPQQRSAIEFDIDRVMRERHVKHQKSWSRLNISDVVGYTLCQRNPHAECLFLKIVLCPQLHGQAEGELHRSQIKNMSAGSWLKSKLMPSTVEDDDEELLASSPALSIWKKLFPGQSGNNKTCCFSLVKDATFSHMNETVAGAGGVLFVVSENIPWKFQKAQLHNLIMSIPSGASLPLLVLTCSSDKVCSDTTSIAVGELGLSDLDKSRVHSFLVIPIIEHEQVEGADGFFSDKNLREGLRWLASESPIQPDLLSQKTRDLVVAHLNPLLDVLESRSHFELVPGHCISAFNEALDLTLRKISAAADANCVGWPCPEISFLEDTVVVTHLPSVGWSSPEIINPLLHAVRTCNLPSFPDTGNHLEVGMNKHGGIEDMKLQLESHLIKYLAETCGMMGFQFAAKEAWVMVQRSTRLELHGSTYYLIPNWILVFRRIFNWRLMNLSSGPLSSVYVSRDDCIDLISRDNRLSPQGNDYASYLSRPSLDDMIKVGCSPPPFGRELQSEANRPLTITRSDGDIQVAADFGDIMQNEVTRCLDPVIPDSIRSDGNIQDSEIILAIKPTKEADRLSKLIEQCNIVQNAIDKKLQIYF